MGDVRGVVVNGPHRYGACSYVQAMAQSTSYVKAVKVQTATDSDGPTNFKYRDDGKEWNTADSEDTGIVKVYFSTTLPWTTQEDSVEDPRDYGAGAYDYNGT